MRRLHPLLIGAIALLGASRADAEPRDPGTLPVARIEDLHYGDALFYFYQDESFEAITRLNAYTQWNRLPHHEAEAQLLLGGLYLSLGLHNEAGARFERLLTAKLPAGVRNRAWFYLAKVWAARGYLEKSEAALRQVQGTLPAALEAEKQHVLANVLMRQGRFEEAAQLLRSGQGPLDWTAYSRFNLGVALVRQGRLEEADTFLTAVGTLESAQPELLALRDRANLALGFAYLQAEQPDEARPVLERVRLNGPYSNKALLGAGWADAALGDYQGALIPWLELRERNVLDAAVQESYLAVPYAFGKLEANAQAVEHYENALRSFAVEKQRLDAAIGRVRDGHLLDTLLASERDARYGWFWQLENLPDVPESRYLYVLLAGHDFQEGLKNYRDLAYMGRTLGRWAGSLQAFEDMIDARERAFAERLPRTDALLASDAADRKWREREEMHARVNDIERRQDVAALGSRQERAQWKRIQRIEAALASSGNDPGLEALRERLRLVKGVLYFRMNDAFKARLWHQRRELRDLEVAVREAQNRWIRVDRARRSVPRNTGELAARVVALEERIAVLQVRLAAAAERQSRHLERLAVAQLQAQKERLAAYEVQARFALASIYDRAANADEAAQSTAPTEKVP